ncbi:MAG TPA: response regulator, partial [Burkholderiaceae bacterium]|nr:response regulator [Burkholderiaceae bacterium]
DITERTQLLGKLQAASNSLLKLNAELEATVVLRTEEVLNLYDEAPCGYHSLSPDGVVLRANKTELLLLGYTPEEFIGHHITEFLTPESVRTFRSEFSQFLVSGRSRNVELDIVCKDGTTRSFLVDANLERGPNGEPLFTRSNLIDNTERKSQASKIDTLHKLLQEVVESLPYGVVVLDDTRHVKLKNERVTRLLAYPDGFFDNTPIGFSDMVRLHWERGDYGPRPMDEVLAHFVEAMVMRRTLKMERQQSNGVYLEVCGEPLSGGWTLLTYTDITAHKLAEQTLDKAMHAAEAATAAKSAFIANVSHELRTPMNAILGLSHVLSKTQLPGDSSELVSKIRKAGNSLLAILNDVLDFSKIESGKLTLQSIPFNLNDMLDNLASIMSINAREKSLELIIVPPSIDSGECVGDMMRLEQVLINLTGNAIKFTSTGHVALGIYKVDEDENSQTLKFSVSDSGIGIAAEKVQAIFSEFSQVDESSSRQFGGTGLGLTISRRLVEAMGGELTVDTRLGVGSEFAFTLRLAKHSAAARPVSDGADLAVVIADDNTFARDTIRSIVDGLGWRARAHSSGFELLEDLKATPSLDGATPVLLLDFTMPAMDGLFTARAVRQAYPDVAVPIVLLTTAQNHDEVANHPYAKLADALLIKPVTPTTLKQAVEKALRVRKGANEGAPEAQQPVRMAGLRMLVVDDNDVNREVAQRIFVREGAQVFTAEGGQAALDWLSVHCDAVDIVLMDIQMPLMNGYEATAHIRSIEALRHLPVVALTAGAMVQHQELAREAGMNGFIAKPFDVDVAVALLLGLVGRAYPSGEDTVAAVPAPATAQPAGFPGIEVASALAIWRDETQYRKFLRRFVDHYANIVQVLTEADRADAQALAHKFRGGAANLGLNDVAAASLALEHAYDESGVVTDALAGLQTAMEVTLASIDRYAPAIDTAPLALPAAADTPFKANALEPLLVAWESDSAENVEAALQAVGRLLPTHVLALQQALLDSYDFRAGVVATRNLLNPAHRQQQEP